MAGGHVRNLVCHYPGQFRFIIGRQYQSGIYIKKSTGQREGVHLVRIDNLNSEGDLGIRVAHQILPNAIDVLCDHGIRDHFRGAFHLLGRPWDLPAICLGDSELMAMQMDRVVVRGAQVDQADFHVITEFGYQRKGEAADDELRDHGGHEAEG